MQLVCKWAAVVPELMRTSQFTSDYRRASGIEIQDLDGLHGRLPTEYSMIGLLPEAPFDLTFHFFYVQRLCAFLKTLRIQTYKPKS